MFENKFSLSNMTWPRGSSNTWICRLIVLPLTLIYFSWSHLLSVVSSRLVMAETQPVAQTQTGIWWERKRRGPACVTVPMVTAHWCCWFQDLIYFFILTILQADFHSLSFKSLGFFYWSICFWALHHWYTVASLASSPVPTLDCLELWHLTTKVGSYFGRKAAIFSCFLTLKNLKKRVWTSSERE